MSNGEIEYLFRTITASNGEIESLFLGILQSLTVKLNLFLDYYSR